MMFKLRSGAVVDMLRREVGGKMEARNGDRDGPVGGSCTVKKIGNHERKEGMEIFQKGYIYKKGKSLLSREEGKRKV